MPDAAVELPVTKGLYSVLLGENMTAIPAAVWTHPDVRLRVWFDDGTANGPQLLTPDQRIAAVGYAMMAGNVPDAAITSAKLAEGAVGAANIAEGAVKSSHLAPEAVTAEHLAAGSVTTDALADHTVTAAKMTTTGALNSGQATFIANPAIGYGSRFGCAVAAVGATKFIVGSHNASAPDSGTGAAHLFDLAGNLLTTFASPNPEICDRFGFAVAGMGDDRVIISAPHGDMSPVLGGKAYLFSTNGTPLISFPNPSPLEWNDFGYAVAAVGSDRVIVGAPYANLGAPQAGAAYIYSTNGTLLTTIQNPSPVDGECFGSAVAAVGSDRVLIGANAHDPSGTTSVGAAYLFSLDGTLLTTIPNPTPETHDGFGLSLVGVDENRVLIGAGGNDTAGINDDGAAYLFHTDGTLLTTFTKPVPSPVGTERFGHSVAAVGQDQVLIGVPYDHDVGAYAGAMYLYHTDGTLLATFFNPDPANQGYAWAVAAVGGRAAIAGAPNVVTNGTWTGASYLYQGGQPYVPDLVAAGVRDGAITSGSLAADAVTSSNIANGAVQGGDIAAGAVGTSQLAANAVQSDKIAAGAVGSAQLGNNAVSSNKLASGAVLNSHLASNAVSSSKIAAGAVGVTQLADSAVTSTKLATGAVQNSHLADNAVGSTKIANGAIGSAKLDSSIGLWTASGADLFRSAGKVGIGTNAPASTLDVDGTVKATAFSGTFTGNGAGLTGVPVGAGAVGSIQLANNAVLSDHIAAGAVDNAKLANPGVTVNTGDGLSGGGAVALGGSLTLTNSGVLSLTGGGGVTVSGSSGAVTLGSTAQSTNAANTIVSRDASGDFGTRSISLAGQLALPATTSSSVGIVALGGSPFLHAFGSGNIFVGSSAGNFSMTGYSNTATGKNALYSNTTGYGNTANGYSALYSNTTGLCNTATGPSALYSNTTGNENTATGSGVLYSNTTGQANTATGNEALTFNTTGSFNSANGYHALYSNTTGFENTANGSYALNYNSTGYSNTATGKNALYSNTSGYGNTAIGYQALDSNTTGTYNIALGFDAGSNLTTGNANIDIGNTGVAGESATIRLGREDLQANTYIAGIYGATVTTAAVYVNSSGKLGTATSSRRFKEAIEDMGDQSEVLLSLRPVSFRYKAEIDPQATPQFGLIAEEVDEVAPALVLRDDKGEIY